ncbi:protein CLEC16A-like isoform X2 [Symsagittifera roscoffensis]|uniref:protein CLEC16A-like isoform X2 n=1 Tax=Symsagittifera roscoffensis TaxID=84072 RepID=UPI00307B8441
MSRMLSKVFPSRWKPKNYHSLENLKYLHMVLVKNSTVTNQNRNLLVETLRSISEIMIWGDQNDSSVFDFFLEKNMLSFFKKIMKQKSGESVCVQLLQTLNILFENISHETSLYFLLSNNTVNSILVHKFDFSDEEVMAYYISFLKILSLKLNTSTVHLFYNDQIKDFPLLTEALKFFNHSESMVRTAVRTITLSCFRVKDAAAMSYICDRVANIYFANLTHDLGKLVLEINELTHGNISNSSMDKLRDLCHEHLDYLSYIQDIFRLEVPRLSQILTKYLLTGLLLPLYLVPIAQQQPPSDATNSYNQSTNTGEGSSTSQPYGKVVIDVENARPISLPVALFLTSHVFHIIHFEPLVNVLTRIVCSSQDDLVKILSENDLTNWSSKLIIPPETISEFFNRRSSGRLRDATKLCNFDQIVKSDERVKSNFLEVPSTVGESLTASSTNVSETESEFDFGSNTDQKSMPRNASSAHNISSLSNEGEDNMDSKVVGGDDYHRDNLSLGAMSQTHSPALLPPSPVLKDPITAAVVNVIQNSGDESDTFPGPKYISLADRPFLSEVFYSLNCKMTKCILPSIDASGHKSKSGSKSSSSNEEVNDQNCLLSVILLLAMFNNPTCDQNVLEKIYLPTQRVKLKNQYNCNLFEYLLDVLTLAASAEMRIRAVTIEMTCMLMRHIVICDVDPSTIDITTEYTGTHEASIDTQANSAVDFRREMSSGSASCNANASLSPYYFITDQHLASLESVKEQSCLYLRRFYKSEEMFLDLFESEFETSKNKRTIVSRLIQDAPIILPPVSTPLSGISANKRLPCGEMELTKLAMCCFFELRNLSLELQNSVDSLLPLAKESDLVQEGDRLNLSNSDLLGCKVITKSGTEERFLVLGKFQLMFVEPDYSTLGWGIVKFTGPLQNSEVTGCADDTHSLQLSMNRPVVPAGMVPMSGSPQATDTMTSTPLFSAQLKFDDHIRVMAARQRIMKGRHAARQCKMHSIMQILEFPPDYIASGGSSSAMSSVSYAYHHPTPAVHHGGKVQPSMSINHHHHHPNLLTTPGSTSSGESSTKSTVSHRRTKKASRNTSSKHAMAESESSALNHGSNHGQSARVSGHHQVSSSSQLSVVNESPVIGGRRREKDRQRERNREVVTKAVETGTSSDKNEEHERASSGHSSFVNLEGDTNSSGRNNPQTSNPMAFSNENPAAAGNYPAALKHNGEQEEVEVAVFDGRIEWTGEVDSVDPGSKCEVE